MAQSTKDTVKKTKKASQKHDPVNHPSHYTSGKIEVIDFITDQGLDFALGNVVKYVARAGKKTEQGKTNAFKTIEDLEKAEFYLKHKIRQLRLEYYAKEVDADADSYYTSCTAKIETDSYYTLTNDPSVYNTCTN